MATKARMQFHWLAQLKHNTSSTCNTTVLEYVIVALVKLLLFVCVSVWLFASILAICTTDVNCTGVRDFDESSNFLQFH